jgi:hypothetical protein
MAKARKWPRSSIRSRREKSITRSSNRAAARCPAATADARSQRAPQHPAQRQQRQPARAAAHDAQQVGAVHLLGVEVLPYLYQLCHRVLKIVGATGQRRGVDRPGRGAHQDRKRVVSLADPRIDAAPGIAQDGRQSLEHAHLVAGARAPAHEDQGRRRGAQAQPVRNAFVHAPDRAAEPRPIDWPAASAANWHRPPPAPSC